MTESFGAFLAIAAVVIMTPGQDTALTIRNTMLGGRRAGIGTALGVGAGQSVWTIAASLGITGLLVASEPAFLALRLAGAAYLVYLGGRSLLAAIRRSGHGSVAHGGVAPAIAFRRAWRQGLLSSLGNPKLAVFFSSLLPQFVSVGPAALPTMLALGATFVAMTIAWLTLYAVVVDRAGDVLRRGPVRRLVDAVMGALLVAFGIRLAAEPR